MALRVSIYSVTDGIVEFSICEELTSTTTGSVLCMRLRVRESLICLVILRDPVMLWESEALSLSRSSESIPRLAGLVISILLT